jgi:hypothetical protein
MIFFKKYRTKIKMCSLYYTFNCITLIALHLEFLKFDVINPSSVSARAKTQQKQLKSNSIEKHIKKSLTLLVLTQNNLMGLPEIVDVARNFAVLVRIQGPVSPSITYTQICAFIGWQWICVFSCVYLGPQRTKDAKTCFSSI